MNTSLRPSTLFRLKLLLLLIALPVMAAAGDVQGWLMFNSANPAAPETIMSTDVLEKSGLVRGGWKASGAGLLQSSEQSDSDLLFRMFKPLPKGGVLRMLALGRDDAKARVKEGYITEGELGYVSLKSGPGLIPVHRFSKGERTVWLISTADQAWAMKNGWTREKLVFWLWPETFR